MKFTLVIDFSDRQCRNLYGKLFLKQLLYQYIDNIIILTTYTISILYTYGNPYQHFAFDSYNNILN